METIKPKEIKEVPKTAVPICVDCGSKEVVQNEFKTDLCMKCVKRNKLIGEQQKKYQKVNLEMIHIGLTREIEYWENQLKDGIDCLDPGQNSLAKVPAWKILNTLDALRFKLDQNKDKMITILEYSEDKIKELYPKDSLPEK